MPGTTDVLKEVTGGNGQNAGRRSTCLVEKLKKTVGGDKRKGGDGRDRN